MNRVRENLYPLIAVAGFLLATWGLMTTPENAKGLFGAGDSGAETADNVDSPTPYQIDVASAVTTNLSATP